MRGCATRLLWPLIMRESALEALRELAERMGFEPMIRVSPYNGLANRRLQPLGHLSDTAGMPEGSHLDKAHQRRSRCRGGPILANSSETKCRGVRAPQKRPGAE